MASSSSASASASASGGDEFQLYLRTLHARASDLSTAIGKLQLRERAPNWNALHAQFAIVAAQASSLYDEIHNNERLWSSRVHASQALTLPLYNPGSSLRIKPTDEAAEFERAALAAFESDPDLREYSALELRDQINDYNVAALKLGRLCAQAAAAPLPRAPPISARTAQQDATDDAELQRTLASMMTGRQTRLSAAPGAAPGPVPVPVAAVGMARPVVGAQRGQPAMPQQAFAAGHVQPSHAGAHPPQHM